MVDGDDGGCTLSGKMVVPLMPNKNGFYGMDNVSVPCEDEPGENSINSLTCGMEIGRRVSPLKFVASLRREPSQSTICVMLRGLAIENKDNT
ncbi:hypothetical protein HZH66_014500 [Vespula vulgaris]|uniref:Uncharacterized protein n=1 Tax=Vespula vulgaris TaxID=7454 RepID=A0A834MPA2_VESVU|nr:hypothetical protein HZH66_014500 [Vespula vulgaris]